MIGTKETGAIAAVVASGALACVMPARPPDAELHHLALSAIRREVGLKSPIFVHPLLVLLGSGERVSEFGLTDFNAFDSASVPGILQLDSMAYRLCNPDVGGSCSVGDGDAAVVLSELWQMGMNEVGVFAVVTNRQSDRDSHQHYFVRLRRGLTGWAVVELTSEQDVAAKRRR